LEFGEFLTESTLVIIGGNSSFNYLIQRYAERAGYTITLLDSSVDIDAVCNLRPFGVVFPSLEDLEGFQITELTNQNIPIIVCSSVSDQARAMECGADYCLFHPFLYDNFSRILAAILCGDV
jgi:DNA-binding response OmpR family regulator